MPVRRLLLLIAALACAAAPNTFGQTRIFVAPFANHDLRDAVVRVLHEQKNVVVVDAEPLAEYAISGEGETHIKGYLSRNPRVRYVNADARAVYKGFLSVELKNKLGDTVWSNLVTPRKTGPDEVNRNLAVQVVDQLMSFLSNPKTP